MQPGQESPWAFSLWIPLSVNSRTQLLVQPQSPSTSRGKFKMHLVLLPSAPLPTLRCLYGISFKLLFCQGLHHSSWNFKAKKRLKYQMEGSVGICVRGQEQVRAEILQGNFLGAFPAWKSCPFQTSPPGMNLLRVSSEPEPSSWNLL